jgi:hypothetical protein
MDGTEDRTWEDDASLSLRFGRIGNRSVLSSLTILCDFFVFAHINCPFFFTFGVKNRGEVGITKDTGSSRTDASLFLT